METLFENNDFILKLTGHDYDFVGIIETKGDEPLTFFFGEEFVEHDEEEECEWDSRDYEDNVDESKTMLLDVYKGLRAYNMEIGAEHYEGGDEEEEIAMGYQANSVYAQISHFRTRDDKSTGFLSEPRERGQFLALVKNYCPERLKDIPWA